MTNSIDNVEDKKETVSNVIDLTLVSIAAGAYMLHGQYPSISNIITTFVGSIFIVLVLPHIVMMYREKKLLNYYFLKYIIETYSHRTSFILRNTVVYFVYYYIGSFNENRTYLAGLSLVVLFDIVVLLNIMSTTRIQSLKERFKVLKDPVNRVDE